MEHLILHASPEAQWQALVQEAETESQITLSEEIESYLVFLLMRFIGDHELAQNPLALNFLKSLEFLGREREESLRNVGDNCLLVAGLFPGRARKKRVRISYYVNLGQTAYRSLSHIRQNELAKLFSKLHDHFVGMMDVLHTMRTMKNEFHLLDFIEAEELWRDTQSTHALKLLKKEFKNVLFIPGMSSTSIQKH